MTDAELEFEKEKLRVRYQFRERVALALIAAVGTLSTGLLNWYTVSSSTEAAAADVKKVAATKALELKKELAYTTERHDEKLDAIATAADASVKSWRAYQSKDPEDMNVAAHALVKAEKAVESAPAQTKQEPTKVP